MDEVSSRGRVESFVRFLEGLRRGARALLVARAVLLWVSVAIAGLVVGGTLDFFLRAPMGVRVVGLMGAVGVGAWAVVRFVWPALRFSPSLSEMALRVERQPSGRGGEMRGLLASAVELAEAPAGDAVSASMRDRVIAEAQARWGRPGAWSVLRPRFALRALVLFVGMVAAGATLAAIDPGLARTGAERMLLPWTGTEWPRRQVAVDATGVSVHPIDEALAMRAAVVKTNRGAGRTPVRVLYRGVTDAGAGAWRSALLTGQKRRAGQMGGELYERLIDPAEVLADAAGVHEGWIEYRFETDDDETVAERVRVVVPPAVVGASLSVEVPAYALSAAERADLARGSGIEMGVGDDERALVGRVLAGSRVEMEVRLNKAVPEDEGAAWASELREHGRGVSVTQDGDRMRISGVVNSTVRVPIVVTDEYGLTSRDEAVYVLDVIADAAPEPIVREPDHDEQLVATAVVDVSGDARDDLGLVRVALETQVARAPADSEGAPAAGNGEWEALAVRELAGVAEGGISGRLDLGALGVRSGDEVWLSVVATDSYGAAEMGREPVRSRVRRLRVISASDLMAQMQAELGALRRAAMRLDEQQGELAGRVAEGEASAELSAAQRGLTDRIAAQAGTLERMAARQSRNGIEDAGLEGMIRDAASAIAEAATASSAAAERIDEAERGEGEAQERAAEAAAEDQQRVRDELAGLIDQLDRGEDGWVARRSIERLIEEQREVMEQTGAAGERMLGREGDQLTPTEQTELDKIAERQRELARRAAEAIDEIGERGRQLSEADPAQSAAMAEAERQGREQGVAQELEQAADAVQENQTTNAQSGQQAAMDAMEQMLEELDNADRQRNAALMRKLASLIESLETLVGVQESAIERLAAAMGGEQVAGLDAEMIRLRTNTLAVSADADGAELAVVRGLIERATEAQGLAIEALRHEPMDGATANRREQESLLRLREALAEAQKQEDEAQQAEQDQKRREIRQAYREQLEQEVVLRDEAAGLVGQALSRRERASVRGLGQRQESVRTALADLLKSTTELNDAAVFALAHRRLDQLTGRAAEGLGLGEVSASSVRDQDSAIALLRSLVDVLGQTSPDQSEFDEGADGGGGGGSGGGGGEGEPEPLLPPIAELMLLRAMQAEVAALTREIHEGGGEEAAVRELGALQKEIADEARGLIERMQEQGGGGQPEPEPGMEVRR